MNYSTRRSNALNKNIATFTAGLMLLTGVTGQLTARRDVSQDAYVEKHTVWQTGSGTGLEDDVQQIGYLDTNGNLAVSGAVISDGVQLSTGALLSQSDGDARYVNTSGDTMTGVFIIGADSPSSLSAELRVNDGDLLVEHSLGSDILLHRRDNGVTTGEDLGRLNWTNQDTEIGTGTSASITVRSTEDFTSGDAPVEMIFSTTRDATAVQVAALRIDQQGDVEIFETGSGRILHAQDELRSSGSLIVEDSTSLNGVEYTWPAADGSADQSLTTDGAGTLSWAAVEAGMTMNVTNSFAESGSIVLRAQLDEGSGDRADIKNGYDLTDTATVTSAQDDNITYCNSPNRAALFTAANSEYLTRADNADLSVTGDLTISMWVNPTTAPSASTMGLLSKWNTSGSQRSYGLQYIESSGLKLQFLVSSDGSETSPVTVAADLGTATWTQLVASYDASAGSVTFYTNGTIQGTAQTGLSTSIFDSTANFELGIFSGGSFFNGKMQDVVIYNGVALSASQVLANYNLYTSNCML